VKVTIVRDGSQRTLDVTPEAGVNALTRDLTRILPRNLPQLRSLPRLPSPLPRFDIVPPPQRLGVTLGVVQDQLADYFGVSAGALVSSVDRDSAAFRGGLKAGDVITAVDRRPVRTPGDVSDAVRAAAPGATLHLTVMRDRKEISLDVTVPNAVPAPRPNGPVRDSGRLPI
jgi:S1-C subfamily serine protease